MGGSIYKLCLAAWVAVIPIPWVGAGEVVISEFMAANDTGIRDEDGDREDWIEIFNPGEAAVDLGDWHLTEDPGDLTQWEFPSVVLPSGGYLLVWASGKGRDDPDEELHANFKLSASGEYLALVRPDGVTVEWAYAPAYPAQVADVSYGLGMETGSTNWVAAGAGCRVHVPSDDSIGVTWHHRIGFDDSGWMAGVTGVGYERNSGYQSLIALDIEADMYDENRTAYIRIPFVADHLDDLTSAELKVKYDDGFAAFINGSRVAEALAPAALNWNAGATTQHSDSDALAFETFFIPDISDYVQSGTNVLAIHGLNATLTSSDFLMVPELNALSSSIRTGQPPRYFVLPSPGSDNLGGQTTLGPYLAEVNHVPAYPEPGESLIVTARVTDVGGGISGVTVHYQVMYGSQASEPMADDGLHGDGAAADGVFGAILPAPGNGGEMFRYFVTAEDLGGVVSRIPTFFDPVNSPEFLGLITRDSAPGSNLPTLHWFVENARAADRVSGTRCSLFFDGTFYDNVFCRTRGGSTAHLARPSHKFEFNTGHHFEYDPDERRVEEVNLNTTYSDKTYLRRVLSWDAYQAAGAPGCKAFPMHIRQNGSFYSTDIFVEQVDEDYLERNGLDPRGALYKMFNNDSDAYSNVEKKTRHHEDHGDLRTFIANLNAPDPQRETYLFDYVDLASVINSFAVNNLILDSDWGRKNHYLYRDTEGTREWTMLPWDKDLTYGFYWNGNISEPLLHDDIRGWDGSIFNVAWNKFADAIYDSPVIREMYLCRLRSVADRILNPPSTPVGERWYDVRIAGWLAEAESDFELDYQVWGNPWTFGNEAYIVPSRANDLYTLREFLNPRRDYLYGLVDLPAAQPEHAVIHFGAILVTPDGNQDQEYIELVNPNPYAVDLSGWSLSGAVSHAFPSGTVVPSMKSLYVTPDRVAFRLRGVSPRAGEKLVVQGNYRGHLSAWGESLDLYHADGVLIATTSWAPAPSPVQEHLRITEVMYHPRSDEAGLISADAFEFIELQNIGPDPLDITGVRFGTGIGFTNGVSVLEPGEFLVLVNDLAAFSTRYDTDGIRIAGEYSGLLGNAGEQIKLDDSRGETVLDVDFDDDWFPHTDGQGFSLTFMDPSADRRGWSDPANWRASTFMDGSPGATDSDIPPGSIVIHEALAHSDIGGDWIELKNATPAAIPIGGWYLSDSGADVKKYRIPPGTLLPAGGLYLVEEADFNRVGSPDVVTPFALSELGERICLSSAEPDGRLRGFRATQEFGPSARGVPFGLHLTSEGRREFVAMAWPTPGAENSGPLVGPVVVSEIMYHPLGDGQEYLELYNADSTPVALFHADHPTHTWRFTGAVNYALPPGIVLSPGGFLLVVESDPDQFRTTHGVDPSVRILGPYAGALANEGDDIRLLRPGPPEPTGEAPYILVEAITYNDRAPWPMEADGGGASLQRIDEQWFGNDPETWRALGHPATPGVGPLVDVDNDGVPDIFQFHWFGGTNVTGGAGADDFDGDGNSNREEYLAGSPPDGVGDAFALTLDSSAATPTVWLPTINASGPGYFGRARMYALETSALPTGSWSRVPAASRLPATGQPLRVPLPAADTPGSYRATTWLE